MTPREILDKCPKGMTVKRISGHYYVYEQKAFKDPKTGKWRAKSGRCVGKITAEDGFMPNTDMGASTKEFGQYRLMEACAHDVYGSLCDKLGHNGWAADAFILACLFLANGFRPISHISEHYSQSYLSDYFPSHSLTPSAIAKRLHEFGQKQDGIIEWQQSLIDSSSKKIAIDGHAVATSSKYNDLAELGYKSPKLGSEMMNMMTAYDAERNVSLASRFFEGNKLDKKAILDFVKFFRFRDALVIVDKGFTNDDFLDPLGEYCDYIIPAMKGNSGYKRLLARDRRRDREFVYRAGKERQIVEWQEGQDDKGRRAIIYRNRATADAELAALMEDMQRSPEKFEGMSKSEIAELKAGFGVICLITNSDMEPADVYRWYKRRWKPETYFDVLKNHMDFAELGLQDYYEIQGLAFVAVVVDQIRKRVWDRVSSLGKGYSLPEYLLKMRGIKVHKNSSSWTAENLTVKLVAELEQMGVSTDWGKRYLVPPTPKN